MKKPFNMPEAIAVHREDDDELLGYVQHDGNHWCALTIFGYAFDAAQSEKDARALVRNKGLEMLMGTWEYYDEETGEWRGCVLIEVSADSARVARVDGPYPDMSRTYLITGALAAKLRKE